MCTRFSGWIDQNQPEINNIIWPCSVPLCLLALVLSVLYIWERYIEPWQITAKPIIVERTPHATRHTAFTSMAYVMRELWTIIACTVCVQYMIHSVRALAYMNRDEKKYDEVAFAS